MGVNIPGQGVPPENVKELLSGVDPEQLRQVMPLAGGGVITMMFTDIVDSTRVKHEVGDSVCFAALSQYHSAVRDCIARHAGHELKTIANRSKVLRARRPLRVTVTTSPGREGVEHSEKLTPVAYGPVTFSR